MRVGTRLDGDLAKRLEALPAALSTKVQIAALKKAAEPMQRRMSELAPRRAPAPDLADNISISVVTSPGGEDTGGPAVAIGPSRDFFYGRFLEFGTVKMGARPFARPAFDSTVDVCLGIVGDELWIELRKASEKGFGATFGGSPRGGGSDGGLL